MDSPSDDAVMEQRLRAGVSKVRAALGQGLTPGVYADALAEELRGQGVAVERGVLIPVEYEGKPLGAKLEVDLMLQGQWVVGVQAWQGGATADAVRACLKTLGRNLGWVVDFGATGPLGAVQRVLPEKRQRTRTPAAFMKGGELLHRRGGRRRRGE